MSKTTDNIQSTCVLCCQDIKIYATGHCDHPICYKCSTRMRVLSDQKYCAVCRTDLDKVIFTDKLHKFASVIYHKFPFDKKYHIYFKTQRIQIHYRKLLEHRCKICPMQGIDDGFQTFSKLRDHMRKTHELFYCDLCVEHIQIFTGGRKVYTRADLARHRRIGDPDDKSHKGHPLCEFCDIRYLDNDELFKHLRREHYFCHFCDSQGSQQYYDDYPVLRDHFREQHYLCEEGPCQDEQFTSVFSTEIDLKAHRAVRHAKKMSKSEVKQTRQLDLGFNYAPRSSSFGQSRGASVISGADYEEVNRYPNEPNRRLHSRIKGRGRGRLREDIETDMAVHASLESGARTNAAKEPKPERRKNERVADKNKGKESPKVTRAKDSPKASRPAVDTPESKPKEPPKKAGRLADGSDFPTLDGSKPVEKKLSTDDKKVQEKESVSPSLAKKVAAANHMSVQNGTLSGDDFPTLGKAVSVKPTVKAAWSKTGDIDDDFPPMSAAAASTKSSKKKGKKKTGDGKSAAPSGDKTAPSSKSGRTPSETAVQHEEPVVDYTRIVSAVASEQDKKTTQALKDSESSATTALPDTSSAEDFPSLSSIASFLTSGTVKKASVPTGFSSTVNKPPPGFSTGSQKSHASESQSNATKNRNTKSRAPPGFGTTVQAPAPSSFLSVSSSSSTTVMAQSVTSKAASENIAPALKASENSPDSYLPPENFKQRNQDLILAIQKYLHNNADKFDEFKAISGRYRRTVISAEDYYIQCQELLGKKNFSKIFSELVALLPDREKQQELLRIHHDRKIKEREEKHEQKYPDVLKISNGNKKSKGNGSNPWNIESSQCLTCPTCHQVVLTKDYNAHISTHALDTDFPALSVGAKMAAPPPPSGNAWVRGK